MPARESKQGKSKEVPAAIAAALANEGAAPKHRTGASAHANGSSELCELLSALQAMRSGDFSVRMSADHEGIAGKIADTFNDIVAANERMLCVLVCVGVVVGCVGLFCL